MSVRLDQWWPDLYFGPINLISAPWLGRKYHDVIASEQRQQVHFIAPKMDERHVRLNAILSSIK